MSWFAMGGYGGYIWAAYGVALLVLGGLLAASLLALRHARAELAALEDQR